MLAPTDIAESGTIEPELGSDDTPAPSIDWLPFDDLKPNQIVLIDELGRLPGVGPKSAQRIAFHLLAAESTDVERLASIIVSADTRQEAETHARGLRNAAPEVKGIAVLGPAEAPLAMVRGRHRFRLLVHGQRSSDMQGFLRVLLAQAPKERGSVQVQLDIDPQSFL